MYYLIQQNESSDFTHVCGIFETISEIVEYICETSSETIDKETIGVNLAEDHIYRDTYDNTFSIQKIDKDEQASLKHLFV